MKPLTPFVSTDPRFAPEPTPQPQQDEMEEHICPECGGNLTDEEGTPCSTCRGGPDNWKLNAGAQSSKGGQS